MASLMNRSTGSVGFGKQQQSAAPNTARAQRLITRVKVETTPETKSKTSQTNLEYLRSLPGITQPFPDVFDPFGLSTSTQAADLKRWRESEIVHGRVAMLAALGFLVGEQLEDFPAFVNFDGHITGPAIGHFQQVRQGFWEPLIIAIGVAESYRVAKGWATPEGEGFNRLKDDYEPGDLGFDPLNLKPSDPEELKVMQTKELNNGRLAMIGIAGLVAQELVDHKEVFEHLFRNVEAQTGIELPSAPKVDLPNTPTLGIPKPDVPVPGPAEGKLGIPTPNFGGSLKANIDKLKVPSDLKGLRPNDISMALPDIKAPTDIPKLPVPDVNEGKLDIPTPSLGGIKEGLKANIEKLKVPSDLNGLRSNDVSVNMPDVKGEVQLPRLPLPNANEGKPELPPHNLGGNIGDKVGDVGANIKEGLKSNIEKLKQPSDLAGLRPGGNIGDKVGDVGANIKEGLKSNIEKLKQPSDLAGLRPNDVAMKLPDVKSAVADVTKPDSFSLPNPLEALKNTLPDVSNKDPNSAGVNADDVVKKSPGDLIPKEFFQGSLRKDQNLE